MKKTDSINKKYNDNNWNNKSIFKKYAELMLNFKSRTGCSDSLNNKFCLFRK